MRRTAALSVALASACREIWWRYRGDVGEMWGRCGGDLGEMHVHFQRAPLATVRVRVRVGVRGRAGVRVRVRVGVRVG